MVLHLTKIRDSLTIARSDMTRTGSAPPESHVHLVFVAAEFVKVSLLPLGRIADYAPRGRPAATQ